jgi:hypothetical protein
MLSFRSSLFSSIFNFFGAYYYNSPHVSPIVACMISFPFLSFSFLFHLSFFHLSLWTCFFIKKNTSCFFFLWTFILFFSFFFSNYYWTPPAMLSPMRTMHDFFHMNFPFLFFLSHFFIHLYEDNFLNNSKIYICRKGYGWNYMKNVNLVGMKYLLKCFQLFFFLGASLCNRSNFSRIQLEYIWFKQIEYIISKHQSKFEWNWSKIGQLELHSGSTWSI